MTHSFLLILLLTPSLCLAHPASSTTTTRHDLWNWLKLGFHHIWNTRSVQKRADGVPEQGYWNPNEYGGSMITKAHFSHPPDSGEPLNVIISANSDSRVLADTEANGGLRNYFTSFDFSGECLGQHQGNAQSANLGDGEGYVNESAVIRYNYGDPQLGTCTETIQGGNHFRYWVQDGPERNSRAVFCSFGYEKSIRENHNPIFNGYNLGRDWAVGNITGVDIPTASLTNESTYTGNTSFNGYTYQTFVKYVSGLLSNSSLDINHNWSMSAPERGINAADGLVAVLDVYIVETPNAALRMRYSTHSVMGLLAVLLTTALVSS